MFDAHLSLFSRFYRRYVINKTLKTKSGRRNAKHASLPVE